MIEQLREEIMHYQEKEQKILTIERPKFIHELSERSEKITQLEGEL